ncbi:MAG: maleylpyruvate isomerase N-terminal domain-containing protein [Actinomycetota bacterium]
MTADAIPTLEREVERASDLFVSLEPAEWAGQSGCEGWQVRDVALHMASVFQQIADPTSVDTTPTGDTEADANAMVAGRQGWSDAQVADAYAEWSLKGVAALAALQDPAMADTVVPMSDLGTHPLHLLGNAIVFDHYCHLRHDIGAAIDRAADLPRENDTLSAVLVWMLAGLPQMNAAELAAAPAQPINLVFDEPASSWTLAPGEDGWTIAETAVDGAPAVRSTVHDFVSWGTERSSWRDMVTGDVDAPGVAGVLDAINVI